ncbi:MAG: cell cycle transcriptional regulator TrcR [Pseudomonadota bacterium]
MSDIPLMPKATAVWLVDNTALTFRQIADFCHLHELEVKAIADGESAQGIKGLDPIGNGQLTRDDLEAAEKDPKFRLKLARSKVQLPSKRTRGPRYTPVSRRQDRPNSILWLLRNHPELSDAQIIRLVGTTKPTIESIRERTHWNSANLQPIDPVTVGLTTQVDLDHEVQRAAKRVGKTAPPPMEDQPTLMSAEDALAAAALSSGGPSMPDTPEQPFADMSPPAPPEKDEDEPTADSVFAKLATLKTSSDD